MFGSDGLGSLRASGREKILFVSLLLVLEKATASSIYVAYILSHHFSS
jgi:hypothetical protein